MNPFNEANTVEALIRDLLCGGILHYTSAGPGFARRLGKVAGLGWHFLPTAHVPRLPHEVFVEAWVRDALIRLNPEIAALPDRADEVLYKLRAIVLAVRSDGLIKANEELVAWLRGDRSMPFGPNHEHTTVRLIDFDDPERNQYVVTRQFNFRAGPAERQADLVLLVNGLPVVLIEAKTPVRPSVSWLDGALQVHDIYEKSVPELFVANVFSVATEGKELMYGSVRMPVNLWGPWRGDDAAAPGTLAGLTAAVEGLLRPAVLLDVLAHFTLYSTDKNLRIKVVGRYQQYEAANLIVQRVLAGQPRKGLIWHFQGSGKSLLMVFAAQKLRLQPALGNPTVIIVVDRIDLDAQISATFHASDVPNLVKAETRDDLQRLLRQDTRKIIITTIFRFGEAEGVLNDRSNIVVLVDEAHRTQEGDLGMKMRAALPNAFLFGLTGTPINRRDHNTFYAFGAAEDAHGYLSRYSFEESIRDGATLKLHFEPRKIDLHIDKAAIDEAYQDLTGNLSDLDKDNLAKAASKMAVLLKVPERVAAICADIAQHYEQAVAPNGFKAMVVTFDQECCLFYKAALDQHLPPEASEVVISATGNDPRFKPYARTRAEEELLLARFRDANDPLKLLIVTAKLLTGFDAPILQAMYLDKPLRDHTLLQAICRTNRTYGTQKKHGLIVDYLGVFDDVAKALAFDEQGFQQVVSNIAALKAQLPEALQKCLAFFPGVDRSQTGYQGLMAAQDCLPNNDVRDAFAAENSVLARLWEAISPDPALLVYEDDSAGSARSTSRSSPPAAPASSSGTCSAPRPSRSSTATCTSPSCATTLRPSSSTPTCSKPWQGEIPKAKSRSWRSSSSPGCADTCTTRASRSSLKGWKPSRTATNADNPPASTSSKSCSASPAIWSPPRRRPRPKRTKTAAKPPSPSSSSRCATRRPPSWSNALSPISTASCGWCASPAGNRPPRASVRSLGRCAPAC